MTKGLAGSLPTIGSRLIVIRTYSTSAAPPRAYLHNNNTAHLSFLHSAYFYSTFSWPLRILCRVSGDFKYVRKIIEGSRYSSTKSSRYANECAGVSGIVSNCIQVIKTWPSGRVTIRGVGRTVFFSNMSILTIQSTTLSSRDCYLWTTSRTTDLLQPHDFCKTRDPTDT
jgi:hypothetical protein